MAAKAGKPAQSTPKVVDGSPSVLPMMLKAALPVLPGVNLVPGLDRIGVAKRGGDLPDLALVRHDVPLDPDHVSAYAAVCGFPRKDTLPVTYPHMLAFPLHLAIMTDGSFPFPAIGTLHLENRLTQRRPIGLDERLQVTARVENLRPHPKGRVFDFRTTVHSSGALVWESVSTYLRRGDGDADAPRGLELDVSPTGSVEWRLPGDLGRRYAAASGDHNPIHLHPLTAKAFGFPRQIAHGMWSKARCLAAVENRLPDAVQVDVAFKKPILLPGTVRFGTERLEDGLAFTLTAKDGAPHLLGRATKLTD
ncbi:MaoC/PaaZ C-terminal domain-containing protein [Nocardioides sp. GCM10027113]|uniref:MaoC family dehydratase n=1 Tax=unclassified Nocardioides TaxID=2615069 RepID=UPI003613F074